MSFPPRRARGRPRQYDPEQALSCAITSFWRRGFAGTSLDDLARAMGMNRPSLYAAFGDKRSLYLKTLERYRDQIRQSSQSILADKPPMPVFLARFFRDALDRYAARGCYWIATAGTDAASDPDVQAFFADAIREMDEGLTRLFAQAIERGEIGSTADPAVLARMATATMQTLALRARAGFSRQELELLADSATGMICG